MLKPIFTATLMLLPATMSAQTTGRITGTVAETAIDAAVNCNVGGWSEVQTLDTGDGTTDTDGDGFAMKLSGGGGTMLFGMYVNDLGFESGIPGTFDGNTLVIDQPHHILHTGERLPMQLTIDCGG